MQRGHLAAQSRKGARGVGEIIDGEGIEEVGVGRFGLGSPGRLRFSGCGGEVGGNEEPGDKGGEHRAGPEGGCKEEEGEDAMVVEDPPKNPVC